MAKADLRLKLDRGEMVLCGGVWDPLSAIIEERAGIDAVKLGSSQLAASFGLPDIGLLSAAETRDAIWRIADRIEIPLMVDFESGFGSEGDIANAVRWAHEFERAGAASIHIDDYGDEKCPWLPPYLPVLMSAESIADKIKAICDRRQSDDFLIMVRSGATSSISFRSKEEAFEESLRRFHMWKEAGADIVWPRVYSEDDLLRARREISGHMSQSVAGDRAQGRTGAGGRKEAANTARTLHEKGYSLLTVGTSFIAAVMQTIADTAAQFRETGDCNSFEDQTMAFNDWIKLVDFAEWSTLNEESSAAKALAS
ncbi:isocitrate lyase/PEP mutase family protein [Rhizobium sp. AN80A]|uniref:isocitrate lyase/PEP mutase family protein n=1 Tax=Rhizobium sp. AN80A TaxID=3040673 RepID=UPI0024B35206|nr:isocitrate lyase/PEP mutase family protein [Rhizobium sp. AN80A]